MIWRRYQNEILLFAALFLTIIGYLYKSSSADTLERTKREVALGTIQIEEIAALQKQWGNENLGKRISNIKEGIAPEKIKSFAIKNKKLDASLAGLSDKEMSQIIATVENTAVQIIRLKVHYLQGGYSLEVTCKW